MYKLLFKLSLFSFLLAIGAGWLTLNSEASAKGKEFTQFSSDLFKDLISKKYGVGFKLTSEGPESLAQEPYTQESGILPGEADRPPEDAQANREAPPPHQDSDSVDPNVPPPSETDGEGPNPPSDSSEALRQEEEAARQRIAKERERQERERQRVEAEEEQRKQGASAQGAANTVREYYYLLAQGDYKEAWAMLAPSFKSKRGLDLQGYECFWRAHQPYLKGAPKTVSITNSRAIVYADWRVTSKGEALYNEPVKVSLERDPSGEGWLIASVESRLYASGNHTPLTPPREHMRPASLNENVHDWD